MGTEWSDLLRKASEPEHTLTLSNPGFHVQAQLFQKLKQLFLNSRVGVLSRAARVSVRCRGSFWHCVPTLRSLETNPGNSNLKLFSKFISREELFSDSVWWVSAWYMSYLSSRGSVSLADCQVSRSSELTSTKNFIKLLGEIIESSIQNDSNP